MGRMIYKNMLKSIATARSESTTKHENKASYNTDYIAPNLIYFFGNDWKRIRIQIEKRNIIFVKNILLVPVIVDPCSLLPRKP